MILGEERERLIDGLKLSPSLRSMASGESVHDELEYRCLELKYSLEAEDFAPKGIDVVPLWESDISITGFYMGEDECPVFIHYYVDDIESYRVVGRTIDELVGFLVSEYVDYEFEEEVRGLLLNR